MAKLAGKFGVKEPEFRPVDVFVEPENTPTRTIGFSWSRRKECTSRLRFELNADAVANVVTTETNDGCCDAKQPFNGTSKTLRPAFHDAVTWPWTAEGANPRVLSGDNITIVGTTAPAADPERNHDDTDNSRPVEFVHKSRGKLPILDIIFIYLRYMEITSVVLDKPGGI